MAFTEIKTEEELNKIVAAHVAKAVAAESAKFKDYDELKKQVTDLTADKATLSGKVADFERADLQRKVAAECGLPAGLSVRLTGKDEKELKADAEKLSALLQEQATPKDPAPLKSTEASAGSGADDAYSKLLKSLNL